MPHARDQQRDECLAETPFVSLGHVRAVLRLWRDDDNHGRALADVVTAIEKLAPGSLHRNGTVTSSPHVAVRGARMSG